MVPTFSQNKNNNFKEMEIKIFQNALLLRSLMNQSSQTILAGGKF
jgi:hypothetical protein